MRLASLLLIVPLLLGLVALALTGAWHWVVLFGYQHPMLSWLPLLVGLLAGLLGGTLIAAARGGRDEAPPGAGASSDTEPSRGEAPEVHHGPVEALRSGSSAPRSIRLHPGIALLTTLLVLAVGFALTPSQSSKLVLEDFEHRFVDSLPERSQPRLLPRSGVADDPRFAQSKEIHLARDPETGGLIWTGEWEAATFGSSRGVAVKRLDELVEASEVVRAGFDRSVSGFGPGSIKWRAKLKHPFSRFQYPVLIPTGEREAIAVMPYMGYRGFPFRRPYLKGVLVYDQDGEVEDLTPEEAASRPELVHSARVFPEVVARKQAEALARSEELEGKIVDGKGNRQPFLTALDGERTVWVTIINERGRDGGVKGVVLTDSSTGDTEVWRPSGDVRLISTEDVLDEARSLPLKWKERRCCDSDGHSYTVTLREVVEPRLAFRDGRPFYMVTVIPTKELAIGRQVEHTLLIDAESGERIDEFAHHQRGPAEDARLQAFFGTGEAAARPERGGG